MNSPCNTVELSPPQKRPIKTHQNLQKWRSKQTTNVDENTIPPGRDNDIANAKNDLK